MVDERQKPGPEPRAGAAALNLITVRMTKEEVEALDRARGALTRSEHIRRAALPPSES